jgi:hypothetical protein
MHHRRFVQVGGEDGVRGVGERIFSRFDEFVSEKRANITVTGAYFPICHFMLCGINGSARPHCRSWFAASRHAAQQSARNRDAQKMEIRACHRNLAPENFRSRAILRR